MAVNVVLWKSELAVFRQIGDPGDNKGSPFIRLTLHTHESIAAYELRPNQARRLARELGVFVRLADSL